MNEEAAKKEALVLPPSVATHIDLSRLVREVERIDGALIARDARDKVGVQQDEMPAFSEQLNDFLATNTLELGDDSIKRSELIAQLRQLKASAPTIHITFASSADSESLQKIVAWLRESVHPQSIIKVGLQPSLIGGAYVRTANHVHDFSLRAKLAGHRDIITKEVEALRGTN